MNVDTIRNRLLNIKHRSGFKDHPVKVICTDDSKLYDIVDITFSATNSGTIYIKVRKEA